MDLYPAKDVLNTLLAVEALLVAASTLAATTGSAPPRDVQEKNYVPHKAAQAIAWLMVIVAVGAAVAWARIFVTDHRGIESIGDVLVAAALAAPLLAIPGFGFLAARWAKPK